MSVRSVEATRAPGFAKILRERAILAWRSRPPRHRWVIAVTGTEAIGYLAPALAGILTARGGEPRALAIVAAGLVEGLALGAGQAWAFPLPVRRLRYALLTALGAGVVWATVMAMMQLAGELPPALAVGAVAAAAVLGLAAIGSAQWIELRHHAARAWRWIAWTALAWAIALPLSFAPGPFVDESTPLAAHLVLWGCGGLLMAYVMSLVTWCGVRRLAADRVPRPPEHDRVSACDNARRRARTCSRAAR